MPNDNSTIIVVSGIVGAIVSGLTVWFGYLKTRTDDAAKLRTELFAALDRMKAENDDVRRLLSESRTENDKLRSRIEELESQIRDIRQKRHDMAEEMSTLMERINELEDENNDLHKRMGLPLKYPRDIPPPTLPQG